jgi:integrase
MAVDFGPGAWVFLSENMRTPMSKDNCWRRWIAPRLKSVGLEWVNFQVMRRTHCDLVQGNKIGPKVDADQLGHSVDVNLNVYAQTPLNVRKEAVNVLEAAIQGSGPGELVM